jgi:hypothetical protein
LVVVFLEARCTDVEAEVLPGNIITRKHIKKRG